MDHTIKVCVSGKCKGRGADAVFVALERGCSDRALVSKTGECMGYCGLGPNVAVDGNILHHMHPRDGASRVNREIDNPSPKEHGLGSKTLDELDSFLDTF